MTLTALVISPSGWLCVRDGEWLTSAELEKQQVPHLGYGSQTPPPPDRRKTWHRRRSFPRPAHTGREGGRRQMHQNTCRQNHTVVAKFDKRAQVVLFSSCRHNFSNPTDRERSQNTVVKSFYLVCWNLLRSPRGANNEVDVGHQLIVKHQGVPKSRAGFMNKPQSSIV